MAADQMPSETIGESQSGLKIHRSTTGCLGTKGGALQSLLTHIRQKSITHKRRHREADTIHRNAVAKLQGSESTAASNQQRATTSFDLTDRLDQPGEHCASPSPLHWS